ncbi:MAG: hypothetical protein JNK85_01470 [Verrucomicrobiales bacterium]|nr:hypothetical protein [Verrucomicrobiales bacterium]
MKPPRGTVCRTVSCPPSKTSRRLHAPAVASLTTSLIAAGLLGCWPRCAFAQSQSLAFTGGVLLNTHVTFLGLGAHPAPTSPGAATGGSLNRTYDDGFNRVDGTGNAGDTTALWGYQNSTQVQGGALAMSSASSPGTFEIDDAAGFLEASGHLEYRGSMGPIGASDWGILLGIGYQTVGAEAEGTYLTDAWVLEDRFSTSSIPPEAFPSAPYAGSADGAGPRLGSLPARSERLVPGGRTLTARWAFDAEMIPVTGGAYFETQVAGRLNAVVSAGLLAIFINADYKVYESSVIQGQPARVTTGAEGTNDILIGGFAQVGFDWALWETASLVASARWQPTERFDHGVAGRRMEMDFSTAFAVHAGFSMRF